MSEETIVRTTCKSCHGGCGVLVTVKDRVITGIEGNPESFTKGTMCAKGLASIQEVQNPNRLRYPLKRVGERGGRQMGTDKLAGGAGRCHPKDEGFGCPIWPKLGMHGARHW